MLSSHVGQLPAPPPARHGADDRRRCAAPAGSAVTRSSSSALAPDQHRLRRRRRRQRPRSPAGPATRRNSGPAEQRRVGQRLRVQRSRHVERARPPEQRAAQDRGRLRARQSPLARSASAAAHGVRVPGRPPRASVSQARGTSVTSSAVQRRHQGRGRASGPGGYGRPAPGRRPPPIPATVGRDVRRRSPSRSTNEQAAARPGRPRPAAGAAERGGAARPVPAPARRPPGADGGRGRLVITAITVSSPACRTSTRRARPTLPDGRPRSLTGPTSGLVALTGLPQGPPLVPPGRAATVARELTARIAGADRRHAWRPRRRPAAVGARRASPAERRQGELCRSGAAAASCPRPTGGPRSPAPDPTTCCLIGALVERELPCRTTPGRAVAHWLREHTGARAGGARRAPRRRRRRRCGTRRSRHAGPDAAGPAGRRPACSSSDFSALWAGPLCAHAARPGRCAGGRRSRSRPRPDGARQGRPRLLPAAARRAPLGRARARPPAQGAPAMAALVRAADIVIEASRPRALAGFGLDAGAAVADGHHLGVDHRRRPRAVRPGRLRGRRRRRRRRPRRLDRTRGRPCSWATRSPTR